MAVVLSATWIAKPGSEQVVLEALRVMAEVTRTEPGNISYVVYQDPAEPLTFRLFEVYEDQAAVTAHTESAHFAEWVLGRAIPALESRHRELYETLDL